MKSAEIRRRFLDWFAARGHQIIDSSSLVPTDDERSLLFVNAGMVQFKDYFLGLSSPSFQRACSAQRCLRAGGKHNDLENVGYTARHHTLFEMLGNFSFGDYFKEEAIDLAWEFLIGKDGLGIDPRHLWITVFGGARVFGDEEAAVEADEAAATLWARRLAKSGFKDSEIKQRITRVASGDNFWMMGDAGPCGPCSEIFYHRDIDAKKFSDDGEVCTEIWNLVFMQYERKVTGALEALPKPCVDTGMGLERVSAVVQGVDSNYDTDLFKALLAEVDGAIVAAGGSLEMDAPSRRVIADHCRAAAFLIVDGVKPSNEGRGYVLRRIIRRAHRHAHKLGARGGVLAALMSPLAKIMQMAPLDTALKRVTKTLAAEERQFSSTLDKGMKLLQRELQKQKGGRVLDGETAFVLYDTYGFPVDMTLDVARESGIEVDMDGFEREMSKQRSRARAGSRFSDADATFAIEAEPTEFKGYEALEGEVEVLKLWRRGADDSYRPTSTLAAGEEGALLLRPSYFYAEGGGQCGDIGELAMNAETCFEVCDTRRSGAAHVHFGVARRNLECGVRACAKVNVEARRGAARHHSATHLLLAALREVLGETQQRGSQVLPDRLRFDFSCDKPLGDFRRAEVERIVNEKIATDAPVECRIMPKEEALRIGAVATFGEKYGDEVRVLNMADDFSMELCAGTHVDRIGEIEAFVITAESAVASGVRRVEALTGAAALAELNARRLRKNFHDCFGCSVQEVAKPLRAHDAGEMEELAEHIRRLDQIEADASQMRTLLEDEAALNNWRRELEELTVKLDADEKQKREKRRRAALEDESRHLAAAVEIDGAKVLATRFSSADADMLREAVDRYRERLGDNAVVFLAAESDGQLRLVAGVGERIKARVSAGDLMREFASRLGGSGGGRPDFARGGARDAGRLPQTLDELPGWVGERLG